MAAPFEFLPDGLRIAPEAQDNDYSGRYARFVNS